MKKTTLLRVLSLVLVVSMIAPNAYAASSSSHYGTRGFGSGWFQNFWDSIRGGSGSRWPGRPRPEKPQPVPPEEETTVPETTVPEPTGNIPELILVEGKNTVENGELLRADTYEEAASAAPRTLSASRKARPDQIKFFGATLYNYDERYNIATDAIDPRNSKGNRTGVYFTSGGSAHTAPGLNGQNFEPYNFWTGNPDTIYSGIVAPDLTENGEIVFNYPQAGIFNSDSTVKDVYPNVGIPYRYYADTKTYSFDASEFGAYFHDGVSSNKNLAYDTVPQDNQIAPGGPGWYPFNDATEINTRNERADYHFGMKTTIPFTMTPNGRMNPVDNQSDPIRFSFAGDDDVWVFIDGHLVLDIGGIHGSVDGEINFADNTWKVAPTDKLKQGGDKATGKTGPLTGRVFDDGEVSGRIPMDRGTFASTESHELTVFYLERGEGASNCKIEFNLPQLDAVTVYKKLESKYDPDEGPGRKPIPLTEEEQKAVDQIDFEFTLYKKEGGERRPLTNTAYSLLNQDGQQISVRYTDAQGRFYLRNGQGARFTGEISAAGDTYYVKEEDLWNKDVHGNLTDNAGFVYPVCYYAGVAAGGYVIPEWDENVRYGQANDIEPSQQPGFDSYEIQVFGAAEARDTLVFLFENFLEEPEDQTEAMAMPSDDRVVMDYGLDIVIDPLRNDLFKGKSLEVTKVTGPTMYYNEASQEYVDGQPPKFGTVTVNPDGKTITYHLDRPLTDVEELHYLVTARAEDGVTTGQAVGKIFVIPATSMYYEENFNGLVQFGKKDTWTAVGEPQTDPQEPGVVGTVGDSVYGSDAAYRTDGQDSNGSSVHVDTTNRGAAFRYTFQGTGTTFFARTGDTTAYLRIRVTDENGNQLTELYRDTAYHDEDSAVKGPLYNVPVFTWNAGDHGYGTYTVTVSIGKKQEANRYGNDFWLDGIRVISPMNPASSRYDTAASAYATDGEDNMTHVTLRSKLLAEADREEILDDEGNVVGTRPVWKEGGNFVLFTDSNGAMQTAEEYRSFGPKEEVYLYDGQTVTFSLKNWNPGSNQIFLGMKAPVSRADLRIGSQAMTLENAADCYFDISSYGKITQAEDGSQTVTFTITSGAGSLVSLTNIKVTGNAEFTIIQPDASQTSGGNG